LLAGYLLSSQGDRMTAAHGVEGRYPFLDHEVVDYAFSLPDDFKLGDRQDEKYILKVAFGDSIPNSIRQRAKQPYRAPDCRAFLGHINDGWMADALSREAIESSGIFKFDIVSKFINRMSNLQPSAITPRDDQAFMLLLSTQLLYCHFVRDLRPADLTPFEGFAVYDDCRIQCA
jgi:asparagine synthase (glutamine-hydrolysing)